MTKCLLHIGWLKTGSTSIQKFLASNAKTLGEQGFHYPTDQSQPYVCGNQHFPLPSSLSPKHFAITPAAKQLPAAEMLGSLRSYLDSVEGTVILSDEHLCLVPEAGVRKLAESLDGVETEVIAYVRRQDAYFVSFYNTAVLCGVSQPFDTSKFGWAPRFLEGIERWKSAFPGGRIQVGLFDRRCVRDGDIVKDFCARAGIQVGEGFRFGEEQNTSHSARQVEMLRLCNEFMPEDRNDPAAHDQVAFNDRLRLDLINYLPPAGDLRALLAPEQARALMQRFAAENETLANRYLGEKERTVLLETRDDERGAAGSPEPTCRDFAEALVRLARDKRVLEEAARKAKA